MKKLMMTMIATCAAVGAHASLPSEYQAVEYIESTGQQYINSFHGCNDNTRLEIDFTLTGGAGGSSIFGCSYGGYQWLFITRNSSFMIYGPNSNNTMCNATVGKHYFGVFEQHWVSITNVTDGTASTKENVDSMGGGTKNIRLFGDTSNNKGYIRLYGLKVYESGELVHDWRPCYTYIDNVKTAGLYDAFGEGGFRKNDNASATADFLLGEETGDFLLVKGDPKVGEPVCGSLVGYGGRTVAGGEQVVAQVTTTEISGAAVDWALLGWRLEVSDADGTVTTTSTAENFNRCAFTHEDGKKDVITWLWKRTANLPSDYITVEYIESTGEQYVKNAYSCTRNTRIELDLQLKDTAASAIFAGGWGDAWLLQSNGGSFTMWGTGTKVGTGGAGDTCRGVFTATWSTMTNITKGTSLGRVEYAAIANSTIGIFATNGGSYKSKYAFYGMQIYENDEPVRDFVPCYTYVDDRKVAGVYDIIESRFYPNEGTGADFKTGPATADHLTVAGEPGEYGTPSGDVSRYGACKLSDGQVAAVTMGETFIDLADRTVALKGWLLVRKAGDGTVIETRSTDETLTACTFTHRGGDQDILTWVWEVKYKPILPEGYQQVEYLRSTGSQYITGAYSCALNTKIEMDFRADAIGGVAGFGGTWGNGWLLQLNGDITFWGSGTKIGTGVSGDTYHGVFTATWSALTNVTKGTSLGRVAYNPVSNYTIGIFAVNGGGNKSKLTLYGMSIYEQGTYADEQKRMFVPCYTNDNGVKVAGLYDVVNAKFYKNAGTGDDFVRGDDVDNYLDIVGEPGEAGEPVCGPFVGYGRRTNLEDCEEVTCTMPETTVDTEELGATLLGWKLEIFSGETLVSTTTNTTENVDTCTFTHVRGNSARLTWRWKSKYRVTVVATGGLDVTPSYMWVDGGEDVSFTATGGEAVWDGPGLDPKTHRSPTCKLTNITCPTTVTVCTPNVVYVATNGVDEAGRGTVDAPYKTIKYAIDNTAAPLDVMVGEGTHKMASADCLALAGDIRVIGAGRDKTTLYGTNQTMGKSFITLNHIYAVVCGLTVSCTISSWQTGGGGDAFDITSGTVSNVLLTAFGTTGGTGIVNLRGDNAYFCDSEISNCMFWNNAYCMLSASAGLAERIRIRKCYTGYSDTSGCGVRLTGKNAVIRNCLIDGANLTYAITKSCPAAYVSKGLLENCTIVNNKVNGSPNTGLYVASADAEVRNCIIYGNTGTASDTINVAVADDDCWAAISYSCCPELPVGSNGNLPVDPQFTDAASGDYTLQETSLCINRGCDTDAELDFAGNPRKYNGSRPDMGCYEFQGEPEVEMFVVFSPTVSLGMMELDTTFVATLAGSTGASVDYAWDFGDGSSVEHTAVPTVDHHYGAPGEYTVALTCDDGVDTCSYTSTCIFVNSDSPVRYVNANNPNPKYPYATPETACRDFDTIWTMTTPAPEEIRVAPGTYNILPSKRRYILDRAVRIIGDDPDTVRFYVGEQQTALGAFSVEHEEALISGIKIEIKGNYYVSSYPSAIDIVSGTVSNVLVYKCGSHYSGSVRLRGPKALFVDSRMTHCETWSGGIAVLNITEGLADRITLTNNVEHYSFVYETALRLNGANAICRNSFIARNASGGAGVTNIKPAARVTKGVLENCTVVTNNGGAATCAGIYVAADADAIVRNCISVGNVATLGETTKNVQLADGASVSHCCSPDLEDGVNGNKSGNPQFKTVKGTGFAYGIRSTSPCFNAGLKLPWMDGALDYLRQPRVNAAPDIGCVESQSKGLLLMVK